MLGIYSLSMISIVITALNEQDNLARCLQSLIEQDIQEPWEVMLVDNHSSDATSDIARSFKSRMPLRLIHENIKGRGRAKKTGFDAARGDIIFSLDADTYAQPGWIAKHMERLHAHPHASTSAGLAETHDFSRVTNFIINAGWVIARVWFRLMHGHYYVTASNFAVTRDAYLQSGGFDTAANGREDIELSKRLHACGPILFTHRNNTVTSGRRFKESIIQGAAEEYVATMDNGIFARQKGLFLSDVR